MGADASYMCEGVFPHIAEKDPTSTLLQRFGPNPATTPLNSSLKP